MGEVPTPSVMGAAVAGAAVTAAAAPVAEPAPGAAPAKAEAEEIDPIAEADVYMAYGRDAQAEEILKDALGRDSSRVAIKLKLAEIYANRKDAASFEALAAQVQTDTGGQGPDWAKVVALAQQFQTEAPAGAAAPSEGAAAVQPSADETAVLDIGAAAAPAAPVAAAPAEEAAPSALDFDFNLAAPAAEAAPAGAAAQPAAGVSISILECRARKPYRSKRKRRISRQSAWTWAVNPPPPRLRSIPSGRRSRRSSTLRKPTRRWATRTVRASC